jgi:hypothetical protein
MLVAALATLAFIVLIGSLVLYGVDSRIDDRRGGWPTTHRR